MVKEIKKQIRELTAFIKSSNPALLLSIEIVLGIVLTFSSLILFLKIRSEVLEKEFVDFDMQILKTVYTYRTPLLNEIMIFITNFGGMWMIALWVGIIIFLLIKRHTREAITLGFIFSMAGIINTLIKLLIHRPRPFFHPLVIENDYSFPSGHAMNSFVFYMALVYLVYHFTKNKKITIIAMIIACILVLLIGISRVYLGVHYPTDVIAGYVAGLLWLVSVVLIQKTIVFFRLFKESRAKKII